MPYGAFREVFRCTNMYNEEETIGVGEQKNRNLVSQTPTGLEERLTIRQPSSYSSLPSWASSRWSQASLPRKQQSSPRGR